MQKLFSFLFLPFLLFASPKKELVVGTTSGYAPYVSLNDRGEYEGFDIDVAQAVADKLGKRLVIKDFGSMPGLMLALKQDKADALIWAISITNERLKSIDMIYYQGELVDQMPIVFWKEAPPEMKDLENLGQHLQKSISVEAGSYQESVLKKYKGFEIKNLSNVNDAILDLKYGKSSASCVDSSLLPRLQVQHPDLKVVFCSLAEEDRSLGYGICVQKSNEELSAEIRKAVQELMDDGKISELEKKWGLVK